MFALENVCDFSNPANMKLLRTEIICDFSLFEGVITPIKFLLAGKRAYVRI